MSKERLAEIEKNLDPLGYGMGGHLISINEIYWLVGHAKEQAERVSELEEENKRQREALEEIEEHAVWGMFTNKYVIMARKGLGLLKEEGEE